MSDCACVAGGAVQHRPKANRQLNCQRKISRITMFEPLELEFQAAATVEVQQRRLSRHDQLDIAVVEFVHQVDETPGLVVQVRVEARYA